MGERFPSRWAVVLGWSVLWAAVIVGVVMGIVFAVFSGVGVGP